MAIQQGLNQRINFTGCSGIGKTTLAKEISKRYNLPFVSGSYSDLVPETKNLPHVDMIGQDAKKIFEQDTQVLNLRNKSFKEYPDGFVSDRSYLDSAAYMIQKLSHRLPECEVEDFVEKCKTLTLLQCDKVIFLPFTLEAMEKWNIEDNNKRIKNRFYQAEITSIIGWVIEYWKAVFVSLVDDENLVWRMSGNILTTSPRHPYKQQAYSTDILVVSELDYAKRLEIIEKFLNDEY